MKIKKLISLCGVLFLMTICVFAQGENNELKDKKISLKFELVDNSLYSAKITVGKIGKNREINLSSDIVFSNFTLKELLNKITRVKRGGWILKKHDLTGTKDKEYIEIDI
jgi:hypothetical protein